MGTEYRTVRTPKALAEQADEGQVFPSVAEVAMYALRLFLREQEGEDFDYEGAAEKPHELADQGE